MLPDVTDSWADTARWESHALGGFSRWFQLRRKWFAALEHRLKMSTYCVCVCVCACLFFWDMCMHVDVHFYRHTPSHTGTYVASRYMHVYVCASMFVCASASLTGWRTLTKGMRKGRQLGNDWQDLLGSKLCWSMTRRMWHHAWQCWASCSGTCISKGINMLAEPCEAHAIPRRKAWKQHGVSP